MRSEIPSKMNNAPRPTTAQKIPPRSTSSDAAHHEGQTIVARRIGTITRINPTNNSSHLFILGGFDFDI